MIIRKPRMWILGSLGRARNINRLPAGVKHVLLSLTPVQGFEFAPADSHLQPPSTRLIRDILHYPASLVDSRPQTPRAGG